MRKLNALAAAEAARRAEELDAAEQSREDLRVSKLEFLDRDGNMLMYELELNPREGAPDPLPVVVNDYSCVIRRGMKVKVPWFVVTSLADRKETQYQPSRDPATNRLIMVPHVAVADSFTARPINAGEKVPF